jgi:2-octaprenylphenol hydroxylase
VGDAAHTIHPLAGQGVNLGLLDVSALVDTLKQAQQQGREINGVSVLESYQTQRRNDNLRMMALMESFSRLFGNQHPMLSLLRNTGMNWVQKLSPIKQHLAQQAMGVGVHLPPLSQAPPSVKNTL